VKAGKKEEEARSLLLVLRNDPCERALFGALQIISAKTALGRKELAYRQDLRDLAAG
jgi:hypothetical protein